MTHAIFQPMASYVRKLGMWNQCVLNKHGLLQVEIYNITLYLNMNNLLVYNPL